MARIEPMIRGMHSTTVLQPLLKLSWQWVEFKVLLGGEESINSEPMLSNYQKQGQLIRM